MELKISEPSNDYPIIRFTSENELWEAGVYPVMFGVRVSANPTKETTYAKGGYCCGVDSNLTLMTLLAVIQWVEEEDESIELYEMESILPDWSSRPISKDRGVLDIILEKASMQRNRTGLKNIKTLIELFLSQRFDGIRH